LSLLSHASFRSRTRLLTLLGLVTLLLASVPAQAAEEEFPVPKALEPAVAFWMRVYLEVNTDAGLLHDNELLGVVYEPIRFEEKRGRAKERLKDARRRHWKAVLTRLAQNPEPRNENEREVLAAFKTSLGRTPTASDLRGARERIRFQLGQRDKFRQGLIRSGAYEAAMRDVFRRAGLPEDLAYLPHVESSFNTHAYSKYGAAGAWQFMRSTGRRYMTVDYVVDERLDPMVATSAAARLLGENYAALQSWPLALTAYNHGRAGMLRAQKRHGSRIDRIISNYQSRTFGFASRNFYAQFLAARKIMRSYESYFGDIVRDEPEPIDEIELPFFADVDDLEQHLGVPESVVARYNPALRPPVFRSNKRIPKGYVLRLPAGTVGPNSDKWLAAIPGPKRYAEQHRSLYYTVRRGDTLSAIARRNKTSIRELAAVNNLSSKHRIFAGQVLQLPDGRRRAPAPEPSFELVRSANAATEAPSIPKPKLARAETAPAPAPQAPIAKPVVTAETAQPQSQPSKPPAAVPAPTTLAESEAQPESERTAQSESVSPGQMVAADTIEEVAEASEATLDPQRIPVPEDSPFRVIRNEAITVDASETLGHFAEWLEIPTQRLRRLNRLRYSQDIRMGQTIKLDFSKVSVEAFVQRRTEYHKAIEEDFFAAFQITGVQEYRIRRGDTLWKITNSTYNVPAWLVHRYNPEANLSRLTPGGRLIIPQISPLNES